MEGQEASSGLDGRILDSTPLLGFLRGNAARDRSVQGQLICSFQRGRAPCAPFSVSIMEV